MKKYTQKLSVVSTLFILPVMAFAADGLAQNGTGGKFGQILGELLGLTNTLIIPFILGIGFLVFVWGMFQFFIVGAANDEAKEKGKSLIVYATLGFVLVIIFWGVVNLIAQSTGLGTGDIANPVGVVPNAVPITP
jgi:hypothetical protein